MASKSRSRSRSASRSPKRHRRNTRESISPIRTASGANLRTPKNYNSGNFRNNFQYNNNYGYQNRNYGYNNNNNRGYYNQRYNNYGRWNRGRGNFRGQWNYRNQWNNNDRRPYHPRNERSPRSRSRSKSYDSRDRSRSRSQSDSRSRSHSRSLSRDKSRHGRNRSGSATSNDRRGRSNSKSPSKIVAVKQEPPKAIVKEEETVKVRVPVSSNQPAVEMSKMTEEEQQHFAETTKFTRSRWETPDASPDGREKHSGDMDLEKDEIFDQWDDDKLREYLLRSKGKKLKKMVESVDSEKLAKQKKKKRSKSSVESPVKESKKKKKRAKQRSSSTSSSSSSDDWSPIHKAPQPGVSSEKQLQVEGYAPVTGQQQDFSQVTAQIYSQQQTYSRSEERTQAVQYPFSHIRKPAPVPTPPELPPAATTAQFPTPVPPPQPPPPVLGEMQVLGPDGRAMRLVPTSVPGPDGKMIQVMQIQPAPSATPQPPSVPVPVPVSQPKQSYRAPPPPPSYPPPTCQTTATTGVGKYQQPSPHGSTSASGQAEGSAQNQSVRQIRDDKPTGFENISSQPNAQSSMPAQPVKTPYELSNHTTGLKKMEMMEKQKRRQEVLKTRFTPRPARSWAPDVKKEEVKEAIEPVKPQPKQEVHAIPSLGDPSNKARIASQNSEFSSSFAHEQIFPAAMGKDIKTVSMPDQPSPGLPRKEISVGHPVTRDVQPSGLDSVPHPPASHQPTIPPELAARGFKPVQGNPQLIMGPNGEMLQMISSPQQQQQQSSHLPARSAPTKADPAPLFKRKEPELKQQDKKWSGTGDQFIHKKPGKTSNQKEVSTEEEEEDVAIPTRKRAISAGSEKKAKKKARAVSTDESGEDEEPVKRKKEKKKKKKNKKKKEEADDEAPMKEKKKKKEKEPKEKADVFSLEHETIKSKKDWKAFEEVKRKSKEDHLKRSVDDDLPLSHIRSIVPRKKGEATQLLFRYVSTHDSHGGKASSLATSTSYEDRFVSLFGSGETETALPLHDKDQEERVDITKKSVRKFKVNVRGVRSITHMTEMPLSERIQRWGEREGGSASQRVSLNVSSLSKVSRSTQSASRSRSRSSSVSDSPKVTKKKRRKSRPSRSSSRSRSKSRSISLPAAYAGGDDKFGRHGKKSRSRSKDYTDDDLRHDLDKRKADRDKSGSRSRSRSRSRSYSSDEDRNRNRGRQMYYNNNYNNRGFYYNNRGRGNRGYYQNYRGRPWYNNNNRGNWRGRWNYNWNNQGWNNRNQNYQNYNPNYQNYRNQRYDNRDHRFRGRSRSRSRSRDDDRSMSRDRDDKRDERQNNKGMRDNPAQDQPHQTPEIKDQAPPVAANTDTGSSNTKPPRKPSPAQWGHDMFEEHEGKEGGDGN